MAARHRGLLLWAAAVQAPWLIHCAGLHDGGLRVPTVEIAPGVLMPVLSIGTGGTESHDSAEITQHWLGLGGRGIDTALVYGDQAVVAKTIASAGLKREDVFMTTKIAGCGNTEANVQKDLRDLNTSYVDLMLIHYPMGGNCTEAWGVLEKYHAQGVLKAIGVSNFKRSDLEPLLAAARVVPAVNQIRLNVLDHDDDTVSFTRAHNITVEAYSPLGRDSHKIPKNTAIQGLAVRHNVSTYQVALRWVLQHGHVATFQSTSQLHQKEDADVFGFSLSDAEMKLLDKLQHPKVVYV
mmetsp:Transcript_25235/g.40403  ORF Transcript_25235/g.40403 Transcript_25235/m.40403 type:complete len:294 (+) Transcript_25235:26-907(+)